MQAAAGGSTEHVNEGTVYHHTAPANADREPIPANTFGAPPTIASVLEESVPTMCAAASSSSACEGGVWGVDEAGEVVLEWDYWSGGCGGGQVHRGKSIAAESAECGWRSCCKKI